jgi:crotonobetainyl-CoA:carnitine CoA-transferase CaiB-like acyl-CoA transferase
MNVGNYLNGGAVPSPRGNKDSENAGYSCYDTQDGLLMLGAYTGKQQARVWRLLGNDRIAEEVEDCNFDDLRARGRQHSRMLQDYFRMRSAAEWERLLNDAGVPAARVRSLVESLAEEHIAERGVLQAIPAPWNSGWPISVPVAAFNFAYDGPAMKDSPPFHGQHTNDVLRELGLSPSYISQLAEDGII